MFFDSGARRDLRRVLEDHLASARVLVLLLTRPFVLPGPFKQAGKIRCRTRGLAQSGPE